MCIIISWLLEVQYSVAPWTHTRFWQQTKVTHKLVLLGFTFLKPCAFLSFVSQMQCKEGVMYLWSKNEHLFLPFIHSWLFLKQILIKDYSESSDFLIWCLKLCWQCSHPVFVKGINNQTTVSAAGWFKSFKTAVADCDRGEDGVRGTSICLWMRARQWIKQ